MSNKFNFSKVRELIIYLGKIFFVKFSASGKCKTEFGLHFSQKLSINTCIQIPLHIYHLNCQLC